MGGAMTDVDRIQADATLFAAGAQCARDRAAGRGEAVERQGPDVVRDILDRQTPLHRYVAEQAQDGWEQMLSDLKGLRCFHGVPADKAREIFRAGVMMGAHAAANAAERWERMTDF